MHFCVKIVRMLFFVTRSPLKSQKAGLEGRGQSQGKTVTLLVPGIAKSPRHQPEVSRHHFECFTRQSPDRDDQSIDVWLGEYGPEDPERRLEKCSANEALDILV